MRDGEVEIRVRGSGKSLPVYWVEYGQWHLKSAWYLAYRWDTVKLPVGREVRVYWCRTMVCKWERTRTLRTGYWLSQWDFYLSVNSKRLVLRASGKRDLAEKRAAELEPQEEKILVPLDGDRHRVARLAPVADEDWLDCEAYPPPDSPELGVPTIPEDERHVSWRYSRVIWFPSYAWPWRHQTAPTRGGR